MAPAARQEYMDLPGRAERPPAGTLKPSVPDAQGAPHEHRRDFARAPRRRPVSGAHPLLDDTRPVWETEFTARQAQRAAQLRAGRNAQPVSHARLADVPTSDARAATAIAPRAPALAAPTAQPAVDVDLLRDQHADFRMRRAIDDFIAAPSSRPPMAHRTWAPSPA